MHEATKLIYCLMLPKGKRIVEVKVMDDYHLGLVDNEWGCKVVEVFRDAYGDVVLPPDLKNA